jgi:hypothetical protein
VHCAVTYQRTFGECWLDSSFSGRWPFVGSFVCRNFRITVSVSSHNVTGYLRTWTRFSWLKIETSRRLFWSLYVTLNWGGGGAQWIPTTTRSCHDNASRLCSITSKRSFMSVGVTTGRRRFVTRWVQQPNRLKTRRAHTGAPDIDMLINPEDLWRLARAFMSDDPRIHSLIYLETMLSGSHMRVYR